MAKNSGDITALIGFLMWLVGVIVAIAIGYSMIQGTVTLPSWLGGDFVAMVAGWIVMIATILGVILKLIHKFR